MAQRKTAVTPVLTYWNYRSLVRSHANVLKFQSDEMSILSVYLLSEQVPVPRASWAALHGVVEVTGMSGMSANSFDGLQWSLLSALLALIVLDYKMLIVYLIYDYSEGVKSRRMLSSRSRIFRAQHEKS